MSNTAAISAAVSLDEQVHTDPSKRYIAGMSCGLLLHLNGTIRSHPDQVFCCLSLRFYYSIGWYCFVWHDCSHNIAIAFEAVSDREAALMTFLIQTDLGYSSLALVLPLGLSLVLQLCLSLSLKPKKFKPSYKKPPTWVMPVS